MKPLLKIVLFMCMTVSGFSQIRISGHLYDNKTKKPIAFVALTLKINQLNAITDSAGYFVFRLSSAFEYDSLIVTCMGYKRQSLFVGKEKQSTEIFIEPKTYLLNEVRVQENISFELMCKVISRLEENYFAGLITQEAFYRQWHKENNNYVRLIEAEMDWVQLITMDNLKNRIRTLQLRRSDNNERNKEEHGDHLFDLFHENKVLYSRNTVFNKSQLLLYDLLLDEDKCTDSTLYLEYKTKNYLQQRIISGSVIINRTDYAVLSYEEQTVNNPEAAPVKHYASGKYFWQFLKSELKIKYVKKGKYYFADSMQKFYIHNLINNDFHETQYKIEEHFELQSISRPKIFNEAELTAKNGYRKSGNLYHQAYKYDQSFWDNFYATHQQVKRIPYFMLDAFSQDKELVRQFRRNE